LPSVIAIDGPAGSGKSSVSLALARRLGYLFVDTGAFYRAVTWLALQREIDPHASDQVAALARQTHLDMHPRPNADPPYRFLADGRDITAHLHTPEVDAYVSVVAANADVRTAVLEAQRQLARRGRVIMAGRDIGSVVLPDADLKIYIDANLEERARRRYRQRLAEGVAEDLESIRKGLLARDRLDSSRDVAPLTRLPDAVYLDTSNMNLQEAVEAAYRIVTTRDCPDSPPSDRPNARP